MISFRERLTQWTVTVGVVLVLTSWMPHAQQPISDATPHGAILYRNATTCWAGWTEFTAARGGFVSGLLSGGTLATMVGTPLTNQENRTHSHTAGTFAAAAHQHNIDVGTAGPSASETVNGLQTGGATSIYFATGSHTHNFNSALSSSVGASVTGTSATATGLVPYLQLLACIKS